jgi:hypothetical protein
VNKKVTSLAPQGRRNVARSAKRFEKFPKLAAVARDYSDSEREAVRYWHALMADGLEQFKMAYPAEGTRLGNTSSENYAAQQGLAAFLRTLRDIGLMLEDLRPADWCCAEGMLAYPLLCPQHHPTSGEVRWIEGRRQVWVNKAWHYLGPRVEKEA